MVIKKPTNIVLGVLMFCSNHLYLFLWLQYYNIAVYFQIEANKFVELPKHF